jgi:hypothetical protein
MHAPMKETEYFFSAPLEKLSFFFALQWDSLGVQAHASFQRCYLRTSMSRTVILYGD